MCSLKGKLEGEECIIQKPLFDQELYCLLWSKFKFKNKVNWMDLVIK